MLDDTGAKRLIAAILKQAYQDYTKTEHCKEFCERYAICETKNYDENHCSAKLFLHSAWAAALCDGINIDYTNYVLGMMDKCQLTKNTFKYLEGELKAYKSNCRELDRLKDEIIHRPPLQSETKSEQPGDPTAHKVLAIITDARIKNLERTVKAIKEIYDRCDKKKRFLIEQAYWDNKYTFAGIAMKLGIDRKTVYNWRKEIIYSLAIKLWYL